MLRTLPLLLLGLTLGSPATAAAERRPNIVLVMVDDMGWSDPGCFGGEVATPNLDRLATRGLRFTQFYNTSRCCPTRAALMTGLYPHQTGVGRMTFDAGKPGYRGQLNRECVTIAEVLRDAGYRTAMVGKWHLSLTREAPDHHLDWLDHRADRGDFADPDTYPVGRGFEEHFGTIWGVGDHFDPFSLVHNTEPVRSVPPDFYDTDAISDHASEFIEKYSQGDAPFFLYVAHTAPHWPIQARPEDVEKYKDTYTPGWDAIRRARYERQLRLGLFDAEHCPLSAMPIGEDDWQANPHRDWDARAMAVHAAMVDRVDQGLGRIVATLERLKILDDTLILFLSDNGASPEQPDGPGFDRSSRTRDNRPMTYFGPKAPRDVLPGPETSYAAIGPRWARVANTPFRLWKAEPYEGGICTPLVVHWPNGLGVEPGSITDQPGHVIDVMATCLDVAGAAYPATYQGHAIIPLEGRTLRPIFAGRRRDGHDALFFEHFGGRAVRRGDWKLVAGDGRPWELYDLADDRTETRDRAADHPDTVADLSRRWDAWAARARVEPRPD